MRAKSACLWIGVIAAILIFTSYSGTCMGQEFTARNIGDFGNVTVMEVSGNYDAKNTDGSINTVPRREIAKEFLRLNKDEYDFIVTFSNFDFKMPDPEAKAFYHSVRNDIRGIGQTIYDYSSLYGSNGKLQGMIDMGNIADLVTDPLDSGFEETLSILSHELMHRWGAYIKFIDGGGNVSSDLLGRDLSHWSFLLDSSASLLYGSEWLDNGNGTYTSINARKHYSPLDLYLMGLYDRIQVPSMLLIENPEIDPARLPEIGVTIDGTARYVTIEDIVSAEGRRIPDASESQKTFKTAFILITSPGTFTGEELYGIEDLREGWVTRFSVLTDGQALVQVALSAREDIPVNPGPTPPDTNPRTLPANIDDGVRWLMSHQRIDGSWMDLSETMGRDTAEIVSVLRNFSIAHESHSMGLQWLAAVNSENMDYLSRKIGAFVRSDQDAGVLLGDLLSRQNQDGGWGTDRKYMSNPFDTSFALKALAAGAYTETDIVSKAIGYLKASQNPDGGWGIDDGGGNIQATTNVLSSLRTYRTAYSLEGQIIRGMTWLLQRQNLDGGFGNSPSTVYDTAMAVLALKELGAPNEVMNPGLGYLLNLQSEDGSWNESPYQTALAVGAVWKVTGDPDLSIKSEDITFSPPSITTLPSVVQVSATIRNLGRTSVPSAKVAFYDGAVSESKKIGEQVLSFPGESTVTANFSIVIADSETHVLYISIDPENLVKESDKSNNVAGKALRPEPTYDFEVLPSDLSVSQNPVDISHDVTITSRIANKGTMNAYNVQVRYYIDEAATPFDIATSTVDIPANSAITNQIIWRANRAGENLRVTVFVDPFNTFVELSKANNQAFTYLTVNGSTDPNLTVSYQDMVITPNPARERGSANISALVKNEGFSSASNIVVSFFRGVPGQDGVLLGSRTIPSLNQGETQRASIDWTNIMDSGEKIIYVQVDPGNLIKETRKDDNDAFTTLKILSLPDLAISTNSITFVPSAPKEGDPVSIQVAIQNGGDQEAAMVRVVAYEGATMIGTGTIPSLPGHSFGALSFAYDTTGKSGLHELTVITDPDNTIVEQSKDNNRASRALGVQNADLFVTEPYFSPNGDAVKDSTQFFFRLKTPQTVKIAVENQKAAVVRTFSRSEFENSSSGNITWDGFDDNGMVVADGLYQFKIVDAKGNTLGSLPVVVDNNRSPLVEAVGTEYLLNTNLTCMLPYTYDYGAPYWSDQVEWFSDETGFVLNLQYLNPQAPEYPAGLYTVPADGGSAIRIVPWEWNSSGEYTFDKFKLSPDTEKVVFLLSKFEEDPWPWGHNDIGLWTVNRDGSGVVLLDSWSSNGPPDDKLKWSTDGEYVAYLKLSGLWFVKRDGTEGRRVDEGNRSSWAYSDFQWSPDSKRIAYRFDDHDWGYLGKIRVSKLSGGDKDVFDLDLNYPSSYFDFQMHSLEWLSNGKIVLVSGSGSYVYDIWLIDGSGDSASTPILRTNTLSNAYLIDRERSRMAYIEGVGRSSVVKIYDEDGGISNVYETPVFENQVFPSGYISNLTWSPDGTRLAFVDYAYNKIDDCHYDAYLIIAGLRTGERKAIKIREHSEWTDLCDQSGYPLDYYVDRLTWLSDNVSLIGQVGSIFVVNSESEEITHLPRQGEFVTLSPHDRFIMYAQHSVDPSSVCYERGGYGGQSLPSYVYDLWATSSLLNLTANLWVAKERSYVVLRGTAQDINFEGYRLEYADVKSPEIWHPIGTPSDIPVINDVFTIWIPPYEGSFFVKLTAWDKAGNAVWDRKRVSWGLSSSITNLYKSLEIFSPNGDGIKDTVELYYTVLEPLHLEVNVYDSADHLVRFLRKDNPIPTTDSVSWDGMDESGKILPDGEYTIRVFDYKFFVEIDNTPPDVELSLTSIVQDDLSGRLYTRLFGHAYDEKLRKWVIEYGEGDNPQYWYEYKKGEVPLLKTDEAGNPILDPIGNERIETYQDGGIEWVVGKKFRLTAEDTAGNRRTVTAELLEEKLFLYEWDEEYLRIIEGILPAHLTRPKRHFLGGMETIRLALAEMSLQVWTGGQWADTVSVADLSSGWIDLVWDNSEMGLGSGYAVRLKGVDAAGQQYYSNNLSTDTVFYLSAPCPPSEFPLAANNSLFEELSSLVLQVKSDEDPRYKDWTDFDAYHAIEEDCLLGSNNPTNKDCIPQGGFFSDRFPATNPDMVYKLRMVGFGVGGTIHVTGEAEYPPACPVRVTLKINYPPSDCGNLSGKAVLSTEAKGLNGQRTLNLAYYIQREEGLHLIGQFDLAKEGWGSVSIDTSQMVEGDYPVRAVLKYIDLVKNVEKEAAALDVLSVDRVLPAVRITYPGRSLMVCPVTISDRKGNWFGIAIEGIAEDNNLVRGYELYYGTGEDPAEWFPAYTRRGKEYVQITGKGAVKGQLGVWDVTNFGGTSYSLQLKVTDIAGNVSCFSTSFSVDRVVEIPALSAGKDLFSPNSDGVFDEVIIDYQIDEYARVDVKVFKLLKTADGSFALDSTPLRTIISGQAHLAGTGSILWDGKDDSATVVPDGLYGVAVFATDACGNTNVRWVSVEVDNMPPAVIIAYPKAGDPIGNIVEVRGASDDLHFKNYILDAGQGANPDTWSVIASGESSVKDGLLGRWNIFGLENDWTLRLTAIDDAGNRSLATTLINLGSRMTLIKDLAVSPGVFSPNNDGKLDTATISYEVTDSCDVTIEISDPSSAIRRTHTTAASGRGSYMWDGRDNKGLFVPDGNYEVKLTAALSSNPSVRQGEAITVIADATPPFIDMNQPVNNYYFKGDVVVSGTVRDRNIQEYSITCSGDSGTVFLDSGSQSRENYTFGVLRDLAEGSYSVKVKAKDFGESETEKNILFVIDRIAPKVVLDGPKEGEYYGSGKDTVSITGSIVEKNLDTYSLRYGAGEDPGQWFDLRVGTEIPSNPKLISWNVGKNGGISDGLYTLALFAKDKGGLTGESKVRITVDNTPPEAAITALKDGDHVKAPMEITGTASDLNLDRFTVEISESQCSMGSKWAVLRTSTTPVRNGLLYPWVILPADGDYCLRLTAIDRVGNRSEAKVNVKVNTHPPAAPVLSGTIENQSNARLFWTANSEADLSGYNLYRDGQKVNGALIKDLAFSDPNLKEGVYAYTLKAIDFAGNESGPSNQVRLTVDLTWPDARIRSPLDGARVSGLVEIKGTAYSADDFRQYRVYIGEGSSPSAWTLVRTSPLPTSYGSLAQWNTIGVPEGVHAIRLEAEDLTGNINTHQISVWIDNTPPAAPVLVSATASGSDVTLVWQGNTEPDLAGYLVYRNDQVANVTGIVIGDLRPYLVKGTTYTDRGLPDGGFRYYVIAMDLAQNMSGLSNAITVDIDTHAPHAVIVEPSDRTRVDGQFMIKADSPDTDIASVQFQWRRAPEGAWANLGGPAAKTPYVTYMDPVGLGLTYGDYHVKAVATDKGGKADPSPSFITVTYTDVVPPAAPTGLKASVDGSDVKLTWTANTESDLDGYNIYRGEGGAKTKVNGSVVKEATYRDGGLGDGTYSYEVRAIDTYGNESSGSGSVQARVYAPVIGQPYTPVGQSVIDLYGTTSAAASSVEIFNENSSVQGSAGVVRADGQGNFVLSGLNLGLGENRLTSKATESTGNKSRISDPVVVVYNEAPSAPTGPGASVSGHDATLSWNANTESDLSGYNLYRDGQKLNLPSAVAPDQGATLSSDPNSPPGMAFDSDPWTYWSSQIVYDPSSPLWWEVDLPSPELISQVVIHWGEGSDTNGNYTLFAGKEFNIQVWSGYAWITQATLNWNDMKDNVFDFNPAYRTDKIRINILDATSQTDPKEVWIFGVEILKENLITGESYADMNLEDRYYKYTVTAVDYYGFESAASEEVRVGVGDVTPPSPPSNLIASPFGANVTLLWDSNSEPDLAGYNVYRNSSSGWGRINASLVAVPGYYDASLRNGSYAYRVTAVDALGNESSPSDEVSAEIAGELPSAPFNLQLSSVPEGRALQAAWDYAGNSVAGYGLYRSTSSGGPYQRVNAVPIVTRSYVDKELTNGVTYYYVAVAMDGFGNESVFSNEAAGVPEDLISPSAPAVLFPTASGMPVTLFKDKTDIFGNAEPASTVELFKDGISVATTTALESDTVEAFGAIFIGNGASLSPDGKAMAYESQGVLWLETLATGETIQIAQPGWSPQWSPDGSKIAYVGKGSTDSDVIDIYDLVSGNSRPLTGDGQAYEDCPSWSSDAAKIAFISNRGGTPDAWVLDFDSGSISQVTNGFYPYAVSLSADGLKLAYSNSQNLFVTDLISGNVAQVDTDADPEGYEWSPDSRQLAFISYRNGNRDIFIYDLETQTQAQVTDSAEDEFTPVWSPDGRSIAYGRWNQGGSNSVWIASLKDPGQQRPVQENLYDLTYLIWAKSGKIAYYDLNGLSVVSLKGTFGFEDVALNEGENFFQATATDGSGNVSSPSDEISVVFDTRLIPDLEVTTDDIVIYPAAPLAGEEATVTVTVRNRGQTEVRGIRADIYLWDSTGRYTLMKSETIGLMAPGAEDSLGLVLDTTGKVGRNRIIVSVDPEDTIHESLDSNNSAEKDFFVVLKEGLSMTTEISSDTCRSSQDVDIEVQLVNSGGETAGDVEVWIEDIDGYPVVRLYTGHENLAYGSERQYSLPWNTGSVFAGSYRVHAVLKEGTEVRAENIISFTILPDIDIQTTVITNKADYGPGEDVGISINVRNGGKNYTVPELKIRTRILSSGNEEVWSEEKEAKTILPGGIAGFAATWNTGLYPPGDYSALVETVLESQVVSSQSAYFKIDSSLNLAGSLTVTPSTVYLGNAVRADYAIRNNGNADGSELLVRLLIVDGETQTTLVTREETIDLGINNVRSGSWTFSTEGYGLKNYGVSLQYTYQGNTRTLANASFAVKDGAPPVVAILYPVPGSYFGGKVDLAVNAFDHASGVDRVEYRIDSGSWRLLPVSDPVSGRYGTTWTPTKAEEGSHTISFRAVDKAGNTSTPLSTGVTIDLTPPEPPLVLSPQDNSTLTAGTVDIRGTAESGATIKMEASTTFMTRADPLTGGFVFSDVSLVPGKNTFLLTATDGCGNVSSAREYVLNLTSQHSITATAGGNGIISPSGSVTVSEGGSQTFSIIPDAGYRILSVEVDGDSVGVVSSHTFRNIGSDHTINATFKQRQIVTLPFPDDFDDDTVGIEPDAPWDSFTEGAAVVTSAESHSGTKAIHIDGGPENSWGTFVDLGDTYPDITGYEAWVKMDEGASAFIGFLEAFLDKVPQFNGIYFDGDNGKVLFYSDDSSHGFMVPLLDSFNTGIWHKVRVEIDFTNLTGRVAIDDILVGRDLQVSPKNATWEYGGTHSFPLNKVGVIHSFGSPFYFDDFSIFEGVSTYKITATAGGGGTITPSGEVRTDFGESQTFTIAADVGYHILNVWVDGVPVGAVASHTFSGVTSDHEIKASFAIYQYTITATAGPNGAISPSGIVTVNHGEGQTFAIIPDTGYHILDVRADGVSVGAVGSYAFSGVTSGHTIEASFAINTYTITASAGPNGMISPPGSVTLSHGGSQTFAIIPDTGYHILDVRTDGVSVGAVGSYTFSGVTSGHTIEANFAINTYTITTTAGPNGMISPPGSVTVSHGGSQTFAIMPDTGYHVLDVKVDGSSVGAVTSYTLSGVTSSHVIEASFEINQYTITASTGPNGAISPSGSVIVNHGESQKFTVTADSGYQIADVAVDGVSVGIAGTYIFTGVTDDHSIRATFKTVAAIEVTRSISDRTRVLVWLNYNWKSGRDCPDRSLIERAFREAGVDYEIVLDRDRFGEEMRNPYYTDFMILGDHQSPEADDDGSGKMAETWDSGGEGIGPQCYLPRGHLLKELREQVYSGKGLVVSLLSSEFLDWKFVGYLSKMDYPVELLRSEIANPGTFQSYGRASKVIPARPDGIVGWIVETIKKVKVKYPAILKWQYGEGKVLFFAFDLGLSSVDYGPFSVLLRSSLNCIHKPIDVSHFLANQFVPVEVRLRSLGGAVGLRITETYPLEFGIYDRERERWITENPWVTDLSLGEEEQVISYDLFAGDNAGPYTLETEVGYMENGSYHSLQTLSTKISVAEDEATLPQDILAALKALRVSWKDKIAVDKAAACIKNVQKRRGATIDEIEKNIADLLEAADCLVSMASADFTEVRQQIDRLIRIWESRWYFWP